MAADASSDSKTLDPPLSTDTLAQGPQRSRSSSVSLQAPRAARVRQRVLTGRQMSKTLDAVDQPDRLRAVEGLGACSQISTRWVPANPLRG